VAGENTGTEQTQEGTPLTGEQAQALWNEVAAERVEDHLAPLEIASEVAKENATETSAATTEAAGETPAKEADGALAKAADEDPFAGLSPAVVERLKRLDGLESQLAQIPVMQRTLSEAQGRVAAMQRELAQAKSAAKATDSAPSAAQIAAASKSTEKWSALKSDFPEWADATEEYVKASLAGMTPQQSAGLTPEQVEQRIEERAQAMLREAEMEKVTDRHGNWQTTVNSPDFRTWFQAQDQSTQALAASPKARDAIQMLDLFNRAKAAPADQVVQQRNNKLSAAVTTRPTGAAKATSKTPDQMTPAELWEFERGQATKRRTNGLTY
jgi:hypothetical protein